MKHWPSGCHIGMLPPLQALLLGSGCSAPLLLNALGCCPMQARTCGPEKAYSSLLLLQSAAAAHPALVVFPRPSWFSRIRRLCTWLLLLLLLLATCAALHAVCCCSLCCCCLQPVLLLRPGAGSACSLLLPYAVCLLQLALLPLLAAWCCSACILQLLLQTVVVAAVLQPDVVPA